MLSRIPVHVYHQLFFSYFKSNKSLLKYMLYRRFLHKYNDII
jgi:hypothetical protein